MPPRLDPQAQAQGLQSVRAQLEAASGKTKCQRCGAFHQSLATLETSAQSREPLAEPLSQARQTLAPLEYESLGCEDCHPERAAQLYSELQTPPTPEPRSCSIAPPPRSGWPPFPGDYHVLRYRAPVTVCTLSSGELARQLGRLSPCGLCLVGTLHTENLGIERIITNVLANPHIRFLVLCGEDPEQAVGHLPGQSLRSLFDNGVDSRGRIIGARGKRPILKNVHQSQIEAFIRQVELVSLPANPSESMLLDTIAGCLRRDPGPLDDEPLAGPALTKVNAPEPQRLIPDPAGFFVLYPDPRRNLLVAEHYTNEGLFDCVIEGNSPSAVCAEIISRGLISRLDHAAYLGQELARALRCLQGNEPYVQDRAPGEIHPSRHGFAPAASEDEPAVLSSRFRQ